MACKQLKLPYVLFVEADEILEHDYMEKPITGLLRINAKRQFRYNLETANCIICVSRQLKSHLVNKWQIQSQKIFVFSNCVNVEQFRPNTDVRRHVRESLGIKNEPLILFVGNFYEWHDVATLLDAFLKVINEYSEAQLILVGDGSLRQAMEKRSIDLNLSHAVHFTGRIPYGDVPGYMASADIAIVPYPKMDQKNWLSPLKLFEYMASARPIVASAVGQVVDIIQHEKNGLLVPPDDASQMADAIMRLITDKDLRVRLGQQAREDAVQYHSWEKYLWRLEKVFTSVV
jgi:glycosyltransferase involved in cell wall biosynthesis